MPDADAGLAGIERRQAQAPGEGSEPSPGDPRRAYARRAEDLLSPELEVGLAKLEGAEALEALLEHLTPVFDDALVGLAVLAVDGTLLRVNKALGSIAGRRRHEIEGMHWKDLVHPEDVPLAERRLAEAIASDERTIEVYGRFHRPDGEERWALVQFTMVFDRTGKPVGVIAQVHDITYPMRLEEAERSSRAEVELRRAIAEAANEARDMEEALSVALERVCHYTRWPVGHVYLATPEGRLMPTGTWRFGDSSQQAIRESLRFGTFNPRTSPPGQVLRTGKAVWLGDSSNAQGFAAAAVAAERGLTGWAGFPIRIGGECVAVMEFYGVLPVVPDDRLISLMSDVGTQLGRVLERRRADDERTEILIREQFLNSWFHSLLQSTGEGICGLDLDGRVSFVNRAGAVMLGYSTEEMQGQNLHELSHHTRADGTAYPAAECPILRAARDGTGVRTDEEVFWHRDGTPFPVEYSSHAIVDQGGDIKGTVVTFIDITERRREERATRALNQVLLNTKEELERANLLKSDFLATMSHELRTPLNAIMGFAGLMQNGLAGEIGETGLDYLERISRNASVLLALINDVLDLSKIEANRMPLSPRVIDVRTVVRQVIENMQSLADNKGLQLEFEDMSRSAAVMAHQRAVHQVMTNLIGNAIKFTDEGMVTVRVTSAGPTTTVEVIDTGIGIAADDQAMVFEAFRQVGAHARTGTGGTGLGLAISKRLARELGGDLVVQSDLGLGSHFTLQLVSARVSDGLVNETGPLPRPVVFWVTSDYTATQMMRDWVESAGMGYVGIASTELLVRAALEMRPAIVVLDLPEPVLADMLSGVKDDPKLNAMPVVVVLDEGAEAPDPRHNVWELRRPFSREELHKAMDAAASPKTATA